MLDVRSVSKRFHGQGRDAGVTEVLQPISLQVPVGTFVSLIGPSGCGKSTLLRIVAGLEPASAGEVLISSKRTGRAGRSIGLVFQEYALFPWRTVQKNIGFGLEIGGMPAPERSRCIADFIQRFGLQGFERAYPAQLSGGMKQRVAIARTFITDPDLVLMDEPFGALDSQTRARMQQFLLRVWQESGKTIVFVTHNIDEAVFLSQRIYCMSRRPGAIDTTVTIDLDYPRDVTGDAFNDYRRRVSQFINDQNAGRDSLD